MSQCDEPVHQRQWMLHIRPFTESPTYSNIFRTTMMQSATPDEMRGRLQGIFTLVLAAGPRLGDVLAGFTAALIALWFPPIAGGILILVVVGALHATRRRFRHYDALEPVP